MEWDRDPLLREEIRTTRVRQSTLAPMYVWTHGGGLAVVSWRGHDVGTVWENGTWRLTWRGRLHSGKAASKAQAMRHMTRWLAARGAMTPVALTGTAIPMAPRSLVQFLREYEDSAR